MIRFLLCSFLTLLVSKICENKLHIVDNKWHIETVNNNGGTQNFNYDEQGSDYSDGSVYSNNDYGSYGTPSQYGKSARYVFLNLIVDDLSYIN